MFVFYKLNVMLCVFSDYYLIICVYVYLIISKKKIADRWVALSIPRKVLYIMWVGSQPAVQSPVSYFVLISSMKMDTFMH